jgi:hypothetical protein
MRSDIVFGGISPTMNCPIARANCASSATCTAMIR